jgi:hypothetical protein
VALCHAVDDVGKIGFRIEAVELGRLQNGINCRGAFTAGVGTQEQEIFPGDGN